MKKFLMLFLCIALLPLSANATMMALDFNDDSAEVRFDAVLTGDDYGRSIHGGRYLYNDDEESEMIGVELKFTGDPGAIPGLEVGAAS